MIEELSSIQADQLFQFKQGQQNNYWIIVLNHLIDTDFLKTLPDNLTELGKRCLDDIAASRLAIPNTNDLFYKIIEKLDRRKTKKIITNIKNKICNSEQGYSINANKFIFLHEWLEKQGDLISRAGDVAQYILGPISIDDSCLNLLTENSELYIKIVDAAGEQANTFKNNLRTKLQSNGDERLATFANTIGVKLEKKVEK